MTPNQHWQNRSRAAIWHPCTQMQALEQYPPIPISRAEGAWLYDFDDQRYFDGIASWWVNLFGHNHPAIKNAIAQQLEQLDHVMLAGLTHQPAIELAERLGQKTGLGHMLFASDGASAVEMALKLSFHYWRNVGQTHKQRFVCLEGSYHGETLGALGVTDVALFKDTYAPITHSALITPTPDPRYNPNAHLSALTALENLLAQNHHEIAALILEPLVQGAAGMVMYHPDYLSGARRLCDEYQIHLIADEIAVGFGRTGTFLACEQAGMRPDILCLSKGITGGSLPLACVLSTDAIYAAFYAEDVRRGFLHSHSYTGNALACRAALAVLDLFDQHDVLAQNQRKAQQFNALLAPVAQHPAAQQFRHIGMIWAFEDACQRPSRWWQQQALARGLLLRPIGHTVYLMPPYCITADEMGWISRVLQELLDQPAPAAPSPAVA